MSDNYLRLVPRDPNWHPDPEAAAASLLAMRDLLPAAECATAESKDAVTFFDAGANATCIACPSCTADPLGWWGDAMGRHKDPFDELLLVQAQEEGMRLLTRDSKLLSHLLALAGGQG